SGVEERTPAAGLVRVVLAMVGKETLPCGGTHYTIETRLYKHEPRACRQPKRSMALRWPVSDFVPPAEILHRVIEAEPLPRNVGTFLAQCAARSGERRAWHFFLDKSGRPWEAMTYRQLDDAVTRLAAGMRAAGIGAHSRVAMLL